MPAAYYEMQCEQGADFVTTLKVIKPGGGLMRFLPKAVGTGNPASNINWFWSDLSKSSEEHILNFDIPEELKLAYPNAFNWLKEPITGNNGKDVIFINCQIRDSKNNVVMQGKTNYKLVRTTASGVTTSTFSSPNRNLPATGAEIDKECVSFDFIRDNLDYNILMKIPSQRTAPSGASDPTNYYNCQTSPPPAGADFSYPQRPSGTICFKGKFVYDVEIGYYPDAPGDNTKPFVVRLLQGRFVFNPNVTTN